MQIIKSIKEMQAWSRDKIEKSKTIGFVPTMGALHAGHVNLFKRARAENNLVVVSIYVNPTQFGPNEDFNRYPRPFENDCRISEEAEVDCVFAPDNLYDEKPLTWIEVSHLQDVLEGRSRPGHFKGVATVVAKLFHIVQPTKAYFGRKDAQQLLIIQTMVKDLNFDLTIVPCETVREPDGLAMSSRNRYLSPTQRQQALAIFRALDYCRKEVEKGEKKATTLIHGMSKILTEEPGLTIDYIAINQAHDLQDIDLLQGDILVSVAIKLGTVRLIDNIFLKELQ